MKPDAAGQPTEQEPPDATLIFHEQADGRKVARLPGGNIVLVDLCDADRVGEGDVWFVRLRQRETFAIAEPIDRVTRAAAESEGVFSSTMADAPARAAGREPAGRSVGPLERRAVGTASHTGHSAGSTTSAADAHVNAVTA